MANVEWVEARDAGTWFVRADKHKWGYLFTVGSVTYYPDEKKYSALYMPAATHAWEPVEPMQQKFDSLEEAHVWLMTLARMG